MITILTKDWHFIPADLLLFYIGWQIGDFIKPFIGL